MNRKNSQLGYTLLQLLLALELSTVVAVVGAPNVFGAYANYQVKSLSGQLGFDIVRARMEAIGQNRYVRIRILSSTQYVREVSSDGSTWTKEATRTMPNGVTLGWATAEVRFDKRGFGTVTNLMWVISGTRYKFIWTSVIGTITLI